MRSAVTISLVPEARGGPFVFWDNLAPACRRARELGFDGVEIFAPGPDAIDPKELRALLDEHNLALAAVGTGAGWVKQRLTLTLPDAQKRDGAKAFIKSMIDFGGQFGAPAIVGSMQGRHGDGVDQPTAWGWLAEGVQELSEHARQYNVPLIVEPINRYESNLLNSLDDGLKLLTDAGATNGVLLADLFHMNIEEPDITASLLKAGPRIGHVHFVDSNRRPAGNGHLDYPRIAHALRDVKYDRFISAEALPWPDSDAAAQQTILAYNQFFRPRRLGF